MTEPDPIGLSLLLCPAESGLDNAGATDARAEAGDDGWDEVLVLGHAGWRRARSEFLVFLPADCLLVPGTAETLRQLLRHNPSVDFAYADSTGFDRSQPGRPIDPHHRPGFSPERLMAQMYLGPMFVLRRALAEAFDPTGTALRAPLTHGSAVALTAASRSVAHVPRVLYRMPVPESDQDREPTVDRLAAIQGRLDETGFPATAMIRSGPGDVIELEPRLTATPPVSIVIPTNGSRRQIDGRAVVLVLQAVESIVSRTSYRNYELVVVTTPGAVPDLAEQITAVVEARAGRWRPPVRFCADDRPFNFSNACNRGAVTADGDILVFLNDDVVVRTRNWLDRLVMYAGRPDIGATGARLLHGDGRIQHAGIWSRGGHPSHRYERCPADHRGYLDSLIVPQNCLAVTGACLAVSADKFHRVGGFSPEFPSSYNDVDLCLKLHDLGHRTVVDPAVVLTHFEASSRDPKIEDWELALLHQRWRSVLIDDPFDNPHHLAPGTEELPPPDPVITEEKRKAGWVDYLPRVLPRAQLTVEPGVAIGGPVPGDAGADTNDHSPATIRSLAGRP